MYQSSHVYQDCTNSVPTVYQSSKTVKKQSKDSQNSKNDHRCINRHMSTKTVPTVYQQCTKNSQQQKMTIGIPIVTYIHTESALYIKSASASAVRVRVRRIHKAYLNKHLAIANRSHVCCARNTSRAHTHAHSHDENNTSFRYHGKGRGVRRAPISSWYRAPDGLIRHWISRLVIKITGQGRRRVK